MKNTITTYLIVFLVSITTVFSACIIIAHLQISAARNFNTNAIDRIQSSNFNSGVIDEIILEGKELGYTVSISDESVYENIPEYRVTTEYTVGFQMPLAQDSDGNPIYIGYTTSIDGYAR